MRSISRQLLLLVAAIAVSALLAPVAAAATIQVTSTTDSNIGGGCNLRDAIDAANTNSVVGACNGDSAGADTILLEGGKTYTIERHGVDNANAKGDFDIAGPVTIRATGSALATVDAANVIGPGSNPEADRVFEILAESGSVVFERLKITGGFLEVPLEGIFIGGGGIYSKSDLTLRESEVVGNAVIGIPFPAGGGIFTEGPLGRLTIENSTIADNGLESFNGGKSNEAVGAGIAAINGAAGLNIVNSTITGNKIIRRPGSEATLTGGGIYASGKRTGAPASLRNVTIVRNSAENVGGAEFNAVTSSGTIIAGNLTTLPTSSECRDAKAVSLGGNVIGSTEGANGCNFANAGDRYGTKSVPIPPNVGALVANGGLTRTAVPNAGSPAIDIGGTCPETDQRGFFRLAAAPCDAGSVEVGASPTRPQGQAQPQPPAAAPPTLAARLVIVGKARLSGPANGRLTLNSGIKATCPAGGAACSGRLSATSVPKKRRSGKPATYGSAPISLAPGTSQIVTLKLTGHASDLVRESGKLRLKLAASLAAAGVTPAAVTRTVTVKPPPPPRH